MTFGLDNFIFFYFTLGLLAVALAIVYHANRSSHRSRKPDHRHK